VFPTTTWATIRGAAARDRDALERFAAAYRAPVLAFIKRKGFPEHDAEDLCQSVFLRICSSDVLATADPAKGRFRSLILSVARHVVQDRWRKGNRERPLEAAAEPAFDPAARDDEFDRAWVLHLAETALGRLREQGSPYHEVLRAHLDGTPQDRQKLWIARKKLIALIRDEVARTCSSKEELEDELAYLSPFLSKKV
jgi:DNA-directed RNA polymerase specialized sigma24 family protein